MIIAKRIVAFSTPVTIEAQPRGVDCVSGGYSPRSRSIA